MTAAAQPRDFLARAVAASRGNPMLERIRDRGAECVMAVYRIVKIALLHAIDNQAVARTVEPAHEILREFATTIGAPATITYVGDTIFVCGQLLRASRGTYESAIELGTLLSRCGVSEVSFDARVSPAEVLRFAGIAATAIRDPARRDTLLAAKFDGIVVRPVDTSLEQRDDAPELPLRERILRFYASALVVTRRFYDALASGSMLLPHRIKRLAQHLASVAESGDAALLGMTAMANAHRDDAGRAVQSAILVVAVARRITTDRLAISRLAMAALLADAGRIRLTGAGGRDRLVRLGDAVEAAVPPASCAACIAVGGVNSANALRAVSVYEATFLERESLLGKPYGGALPILVQSQILQVVRGLLDRLAPRDATAPMPPLRALEHLATSTEHDATMVRLLVEALGVVPIGSVLELESGEWAVAVGPSANAEALDRPRVRLVTDKSGRVLSNTPEFDLGAPPEGRRFPAVLRIVPPNEARFNVTRVFVT